MEECECKNWCDRDIRVRLLKGHSDGCVHGEIEALNKAFKLIAALAHGMEVWASDEGGIHAAAWEAYRKAKALEGVVVPDEAMAFLEEEGKP